MLLALASVAGAGAGPVERTLEDWRWSRFDVEHGLPSNDVIELAESATGDVWAATSAGVAWFDGWRWVAMGRKQGMPPEAPLALCVAPGGRVWIAMEDGLYCGDELGFTRCRSLDEVGVTHVDSLEVDDEGGLLLLGRRGPAASDLLFRIVDDEIEELPAPSPVPIEPTVSRLQRTASGRLWLVTGEGARVWNGAGWDEHFLRGGSSYGHFVLDENERGEGVIGFWRRSHERQVWAWSAGGAPARVASEDGGVLVQVAVAPDGDAISVYDTREIRMRRTGEWRGVPALRSRLSDIRFLRYRADGDLWIGTSSGLRFLRLSSDRWARWFHEGTFDQRNRINGLCFDAEGNVVLATAGGLDRRRPDGECLGAIPLPEEMADGFTSAAVDRTGAIWASHGGVMEGVARWDGTTWTRFRTATDGIPLGMIHEIATDRHGELWFLSLARRPRRTLEESGGVFRLRDGELVTWERSADLRGARVYDFEEGSDGALWFACSRGVWRLFEGNWREWATEEGLREDRVSEICEDEEGAMWFGQTLGLGRIDGAGVVTYLELSPVEGRNFIWDLELGERGELWITTPSGLHRLHEGELATIDERLGLESPNIWPVACRDGRVYAGSLGGGVFVLDLASLVEPPPRVRLDAPTRDDDEVRFRWRVDAWWGGTSAPYLLSRFRLDEGEWSEWSGDYVFVTEGIRAGTYEYEVQAKDLLGRVGVASAHGRFEVPGSRWHDPFLIGALFLLVAGSFLSLGLLYARRRAHRVALRKSEAEHRLLMEQASDAILICDRDGVCLRANARAAELFGFSGDELVGQPVLTRFSRPEDGLPADILDSLGKGDFVLREFRIDPRAGDELIVEVSAKFLADGRLQLIVRDLTERRRLEQERIAFERELTEIQRHESLGILAGGVAHDFNNLLTIILGYADQARRSVLTEPKARVFLDKVIQAARRAGELTQELLSFAGHDSIRPQPIDLNHLVSEMQSLLGASVDRRVKLTTDLAPNLPAVHADAARLRQLVLNLTLNAAEAIGERAGTVQLRTRPMRGVDLPGGESGTEGFAAEDDLVSFEVIDNGCGMDEDTRARIFDPFFTTKFQGRGLGLAAVKGIVRSHHGVIRIETEPGRGSTFHVVLPACLESVTATPERREETMPPTQGTILVVDDEEAVCEVTAAMLRNAGFQTVTAYGGRDGVARYREHAGEIGCAVVDLTMPGFDGLETRAAIREIDPQVPVLIMSGYRRKDSADPDPSGARGGFIQKPFSAEELRTFVRSLVEA